MLKRLEGTDAEQFQRFVEEWRARGSLKRAEDETSEYRRKLMHEIERKIMPFRTYIESIKHMRMR